jgi:hypothetical protein
LKVNDRHGPDLLCYTSSDRSISRTAISMLEGISNDPGVAETINVLQRNIER